MTNTQIINNLWQEFREAINQTYRSNDATCRTGGFNDDINCLRDYAEDVSWTDDLAALLGRETANERQHRSNRPQVIGFSAGTAAKLILMTNACKGAELTELPRATAFLVLRQTAVEAEVIGWLCRERLVEPWRRAVKSFDYAKLMQASA